MTSFSHIPEIQQFRQICILFHVLEGTFLCIFTIEIEQKRLRYKILQPLLHTLYSIFSNTSPWGGAVIPAAWRSFASRISFTCSGV